MTRQVKTSATDPLQIAELTIGAGVIGLTLCPGKRGASLSGAWWERDLALDVAAIAAWGARAVVTLIETQEFTWLGVEALPGVVRSAGIAWHHLPIEDVSVPDQRFEQEWRIVWPHLHGRLNEGERVLVHCRGGLGRAGTVAALMLIECGEAPERAIARVRAVRPGRGRGVRRHGSSRACSAVRSAMRSGIASSSTAGPRSSAGTVSGESSLPWQPGHWSCRTTRR